MINNSTGLLFDLDGVLLDSETDLKWFYNAIKKTLLYFGLKISNENIEKFHFNNIYKFNQTCSELGLNIEELWSIRNKYYIEEKIKAIKNRLIFPYSDVKSLYKLKGNYGLYILSNSPQEIVDLFIYEFKYEDLFDYAVGRGNSYSDLLKMKPNSYLLNKLKDKINNEKLIYIGDTEIDRKFAENTGLEFIFLSRNNCKKSFKNLNDIVKYIISKQ